ncbi:MAG: hypothetical protein ACMVY4_10655 [Minwuia sp.]|uniref:hypothetical protein n=1 Tax=Minwuia sp. TaxID=2493630 RepID=UPI003A8B78F6
MTKRADKDLGEPVAVESGPGHQIIHVPNTLRAKVGSGTRVDPALIKKAQRAVDGMATEFRERARIELEEINDMVMRAPSSDDIAACYQEIFDTVHDLKGQGSTFGFTLLTSIGDSLCRYLDTLESPSVDHLTIIAPHVEALRAIIRFDVQGSEDPVGQKIVESLYKLTTRGR